MISSYTSEYSKFDIRGEINENKASTYFNCPDFWIYQEYEGVKVAVLKYDITLPHKINILYFYKVFLPHT